MTRETERWTPSQTEALRRLWNETSLTASEIAIKHWREVGNRTRSSIIGKADRMGLAGRKRGRRCEDTPGTQRKPRGGALKPHGAAFYGKGQKPARILLPDDCFTASGLDDALDDIDRW
jgi:hypothetical protein